MKRNAIAHLLQLCLAAVLLGSGCSEPKRVEVVKVDNHRLEVSFTERAETILRQEYPIAMPVSGRIDRIELEIGDPVRQGEILANIDQTPARQEVEARDAGVELSKARQQLTADTSVEEAELARSRRGLQALRAQQARLGPAREAAQLALKNARKELARVQNLVGQGALPSRELESAQLALEQSQSSLASTLAEERVLSAQISEARAAVNSVLARVQLKKAEAASQSAGVDEAETRKNQAEYTLEKSRLVSPVEGVVLARYERGPKELPAGTPLLLLGKLKDLEAECDVLSQDALRISRGTPVFLDAGVAYKEPLRGEVRLKEPQGFTKRSSLGVEQQRVRVRIGLLNPPPGLGVGYELWARFQLQERTTLALPRSCFVRYGSEFRVWKVEGNKLELLPVEVGLKGNDYWELGGSSLTAGDRVVKSPSDDLEEGMEVEAEGSS